MATIGQQRRTRSTSAASSKGWPRTSALEKFPGCHVSVVGQLATALVRPRMLRNPARPPLCIARAKGGKGRYKFLPCYPHQSPVQHRDISQRGEWRKGGSLTGIICTPGLPDEELGQQTSPSVQANPTKPATNRAAPAKTLDNIQKAKAEQHSS